MTIFANCVALAVYIPFPEDDSNATNSNLVSRPVDAGRSRVGDGSNVLAHELSAVFPSSAPCQCCCITVFGVC